jgi:MinD-like ATPase involved in chromosome partitioning or flagellar assembly
MSERDFFEKFGTAGPGRPQPDSEPPQQHPDTGQHRRSPRADDDPQDNTPAGGLPLRELHSGPQPVSEFPERAPEFEPAAAAETGEPGDPDEFTVEYVREARTVPPQRPAPHRQPEVGAPWSPPPPAPAAAARPQPRVTPPPAGSGAPSGQLLGEQVRANDLVSAKKIPSSLGWRKWIHKLSFGTINPGESPDEQFVRWNRDQISSPLAGTFSVVVLGGKGGVGKTSSTVVIGSTFAALRPREQVIALDADPGQGANLAVRIDRSASSSYGDIVAAKDLVRYSDVRARVGHNTIGLDVLASPAHRASTARAVITGELYVNTRRRLEQFYNILLTDCGVDIQHPVMDGVLTHADALVMVTSANPDGAEGAAKQMDWLAHHPRYRHVLNRMVLVINHIRPPSHRRDRKDTDALINILVERFGQWVPEERIVVVPYDRHIAQAGVIDLEELNPLTRRRFLEVTGTLATGFSTAETL